MDERLLADLVQGHVVEEDRAHKNREELVIEVLEGGVGGLESGLVLDVADGGVFVEGGDVAHEGAGQDQGGFADVEQPLHDHVLHN